MWFQTCKPQARGALRAVGLCCALLTSACGGAAPASPTLVPSPPSATSVPATPAAALTPAASGGLDALALQMHLPRLDGVTLRVLGWPDIYPNDLFSPFEHATGALVERTGVFSTDELIAKMSSATTDPYDLISASADSIGSNIEQGLVQPIDVTKLSHYGELVPRLAGLEVSHKAGVVYGVPMVWGYNALIYDNDVLTTPPTSWSVLWDPAYKGKIAIWDDVSFVTDAARMLGLGTPNPAAVFDLSDTQLDQVQVKLRELKAQNPIYWQTEPELNELFAQHKVVVALGWLDTAFTLQRQGHNVRATHPREGAEFWVDHWMIPAASHQAAAAQELIDYALAPQVQAWFFDRNYTVTNPQAIQYIAPELITTSQRVGDINVAELPQVMEQFNFSQPVRRRDIYSELWNRMKAGP